MSYERLGEGVSHYPKSSEYPVRDDGLLRVVELTKLFGSNVCRFWHVFAVVDTWDDKTLHATYLSEPD